ncbi:tetratricopeptide repeat protein [Actinotalea sp. K2]|uniref:tetratricopeptide repeat protein n=1 Tax=Actinotalea sp. K2 TaxID=2939438 RepID=UPI002017717C|nr:tetratricopeptide repeat protein [Actinotalea sp. K2]MCL3861022.1 tetratricopeptide repeat protein [Actinotalea sp. K2]
MPPAKDGPGELPDPSLTALTEPAFVGAGRRALVEGLVTAYDQVNRGDGPVWIALEAASGAGKTRVAREMYARLAAERQHSGRYWPASILGSAAASADVSARRKQVHPHVVHRPGTLPAFWWWGIAASMRNGEPSSALTEDVRQLEAHAPYLDDTWRRLATWSERHAGWWKRPLGDATEEAVTELAGRAVEAAAGVAVPGLGLAVGLVEALRAQRTAARARVERLASAGPVATDGLDLVDRTVETLVRLARPGLPAVVFVEDAHDADPVLAELLERLVASDAAILVLTTAWPGHAQENPHVARAMAARPDRLVVVDSEAPTLPPPFGPTASLGPLTDVDRASIVRHYYPRVETSTLESLVARYSNPLALELFCLLGRYRDRFPDGDLRLPAAEVARLPQTVQDLYRDLWRELPSPVRRALTLASLGIPAAIDPAGSTDLAWHQPLLLRTLAGLRVAPTDEVARALESAPTTRAWARVVDDALRQFHEVDQLRVAHDDDEFLFDSDREEFHDALADHVDAALAEGTLATTEEVVHAARLALALHAQGRVGTDLALHATHVVLAALADQPRELSTRIVLAERVLSLCSEDSPKVRSVRWLYAQALSDSGRPDLAIHEWTTLRAAFDADAAAPGTDQETDDALWVANNLAADLLDAGRLDEALTLLGRVTAEQSERYGTGHPHTLTARANTAVALRELGRHDDALAESRAILADSTATLGPDHEQTLLSRGAVVDILSTLGRFDEELEMAEALVEDSDRLFGADSERSLQARTYVSRALRALGQQDRAAELDATLLADHERLNGPTHPATLFARSSLAAALLVDGQFEQAVSSSENLLRDGRRVLGERHPKTLAMATDLCRVYLVVGRTEDALVLGVRVLTDCTDVLGSDHPSTLAIERLILTLVRHLGHPEDVITHGTEVQDAHLRVLGAGHPLTLTCTFEIAAAYRAVGRTEDALALDREVLEERFRILGDEHPDTDVSRWALAEDLVGLGRFAEAHEVAERRHSLLERRLGPDHHETISALDDVARIEAALRSL